MVKIDHQAQRAMIVLRPNCSSCWASNRRIIVSVLAANAVFASGFVSIGAWMVLPFMGLELLALWLVLRHVFAKLQVQQVLRLDGELFSIEYGHQFAERRWQWARRECSLLVTVKPHPWDPLQLRLSRAGEDIALGPFLNRDDSKLLLETLRHEGIPVRQYSGDGELRL